jgi:hypothetical protein
MTEKINEDDLGKALEVIAENPDAPGLAGLMGLAVTELSNRLKESPGQVGATALTQIINAGAKAAANTPPEEKKHETSVLEMVKDSSLPDERKKELLLTERERLQEQLELVYLELEEL